jgi:hypothetical protein
VFGCEVVKRLGVPRGELILLLVSGLVRWHCNQGAIPDPCGVRDRGIDPDRGAGGNLGGARDREDPRDRGGSCAETASIISIFVN